MFSPLPLPFHPPFLSIVIWDDQHYIYILSRMLIQLRICGITFCSTLMAIRWRRDFIHTFCDLLLCSIGPGTLSTRMITGRYISMGCYCQRELSLGNADTIDSCNWAVMIS